MATNVELLGSYWTLAGGGAEPHTDHEYCPWDFKDRVEALARAGFKGMGIWHADLEHTLQKRSLKDMKHILDDNGIKHVELEFLGGWFLDGEEKRQSDILRQKLFEAADVLRPHHIKVGHFVKTQASMQKIIDSFAELCADGANHGALIGFEMMPFCDVDSVEKALQLVRGAGAKNGGICLDLWHIVKQKTPYQQVAGIPRKYITSIEINDGTFECPWSLHEDTINHRQLCGEGEFDVKGFVAAMLQAGYKGPWGIEVLNAELRKRPLEEIAARAYKTTLAQFPGQRAAASSKKPKGKKASKAKPRKTRARKAKSPKRSKPKSSRRRSRK
jgi:sugar phosphate isomerase/epimerase